MTTNTRSPGLHYLGISRGYNKVMAALNNKGNPKRERRKELTHHHKRENNIYM